MGLPETFKTLAAPIRRDILILLRKGKLSAGEITTNFDITNAAISYHLAQLKKVDLVFESKYKNFIYYELNTSILDELILWFEQFKGENENEK